MRLPLPLVAANVAVVACAALVAGPLRAEQQQVAAAAPTAAPSPVAVPAAPRAAAAPAPRPSPKAVPTTAAPAPVRMERVVTRTGFRPYARVGPVTLHFPGDVVEVVGLHQSGHDGAQAQDPVKGKARMGLLDTRSRDTNPQGAADIVLDPRREVRAPVTGSVLRAGTYTLYCDHVDDYVVVEPDARPGWEVKLLHFEGLAVAAGDRVQAGVTVVGTNARVLPFPSQVDKHTVAPHWPHVHVEVVDPSVPDRPSGKTCD